MFLVELVEALRNARVRFAVAGGYAVALHGATRGTIDVDLVLALDRKQMRAAEKALLSLGLVSRLPVTADQVFDFREEYIANRNLIAWNFYHPNDPGKLVDILITHDLRKLKTTQVRVGRSVIPILDIPSLIAVKKVANRPQDVADIRALERLL